MSQNFVPCIALVEFHGDAGYVKDALFKAVKNSAPTNNFRVHTYHDMDSFMNDLRKGNQKFHGVVLSTCFETMAEGQFARFMQLS